jgi:hypothetical protein
MHPLDCGSFFLTDKGVDPVLMPDGLHPEKAGMEVLAECLAPTIALYMEDGLARDPRIAEGVVKLAPPSPSLSHSISLSGLPEVCVCLRGSLSPSLPLSLSLSLSPPLSLSVCVCVCV